MLHHLSIYFVCVSIRAKINEHGITWNIPTEGVDVHCPPFYIHVSYDTILGHYDIIIYNIVHNVHNVTDSNIQCIIKLYINL